MRTSPRLEESKDVALAPPVSRNALISAEGPMPSRSAYLRQRAYECVPAALVLITVLIPFGLWALSARLTFVVLCGYLVYLAYLSVDLSVRQAVEVVRMRRLRGVDWQARLEHLGRPYERLAELDRASHLSRNDREERAGLLRLICEDKATDPRRLWQLVVVPIATEGPDVLRPTLEAMLAADYPTEQLAVCVSFESRCQVWSEEAVEALIAPYRDRFGMIWCLRHPDGLPGEAKVKGANLSWAAKQARLALHAAGIDDDDVVVSAFDCDTRASRDYFAVLAWTFLTDPGRDVNSYQPVLLFHNNVWEVPAVSRLVGYLASMWNMGDLTRRGRAQLFSSHATGMRALVRVDFWATNVVPDDSRQHWRLYYGTDGQSRTQPLHVPVYLDAVQHRGYLKTLAEQYLQIRRWSYGVIDFPYIMAQNAARQTIPLRLRVLQTIRQLSSFHKRAATPLLLLIATQIVQRLYTTAFVQSSVLTSTAAALQSWTWLVGLISSLIGMLVSFVLLPARPANRSPLVYLKLVAEWVLLPVVLPVFVSLPALEVQLRLVVRRYLQFRVTVKNRLVAGPTPLSLAEAPLPLTDVALPDAEARGRRDRRDRPGWSSALD